MDRLHALTGTSTGTPGRTVAAAAALTLVFVAGCDEERATSESPAPESSGRVNAVAQKQDDGPSLEAFCDVYHEPSEAKRFTFPEVAPQPPEPTDGWRWVNLWATWCKPCIEEMPLLVEWVDRLDDKGLADLTLVAVGDSRDKIEKFRENNPDTPESLRMADTEGMKDWITSLGLDRGAPLPIHIFVSPDNKARCLRAAGIGEDDFAAVEKLITSED